MIGEKGETIRKRKIVFFRICARCSKPFKSLKKRGKICESCNLKVDKRSDLYPPREDINQGIPSIPNILKKERKSTKLRAYENE